MNVNFNNKTFLLVENSANGKVDFQTIFKYQQQGNLVTANYFGGNIQYGKIIAMKGPAADGEIKNTYAVLGNLGLEISEIHKYKLPFNYGERRIVVIMAKKPC